VTEVPLNHLDGRADHGSYSYSDCRNKMATSPVLSFIDSQSNQARRKAKSRLRNDDERVQRHHSMLRPVRPTTTIGSYIYAIIVDGVVRYIGKGRNGRMYTHLIEAKRKIIEFQLFGQNPIQLLIAEPTIREL
jgi:hypothetical protein